MVNSPVVCIEYICIFEIETETRDEQLCTGRTHFNWQQYFIWLTAQLIQEPFLLGTSDLKEGVWNGTGKYDIFLIVYSSKVETQTRY